MHRAPLSSIASAKRFIFVDVIRGLAAVSVLLYHCIELFEWNEFPNRGVLVWFRIGWMGVDMFFVLSGMVVTLSMFREMEENPSDFRKRFLTKRIARILPLHYLTVVVTVVFVNPQLMQQENFFSNLVSHLLFCHHNFLGYHGSINGSNWSVGTEMQFYLIVAVFAQYMKRAPAWSLATAGVSLSWAWRAFAYWYVRLNSSVFPNEVFSTFWLSTQLPGMLDSFVMGILLAKHIYFHNGQTKMTRPMWMLTAGVWLLTLQVFWLHVDYWQNARLVIMWRSSLASACALLLRGACSLRAQQRFEKLLACLSYIGTISYGLYLWHLPVILSLLKLTWSSSKLTQTCYTLILTSFLSAASWHLFERPTNALLIRYGM